MKVPGEVQSWSTAACGAVMEDPPAGWTMRRRPKCNRTSDHEGEHREYDKRSFAVRATWADDQCRAS